MNARVAELARHLRRRNSPAAAPLPPNVEVAALPAGDQPSGSSELPTSAPIEVVPGDAHVTLGPVAIIPPGARAAIDIPSSGSKSTDGEVKVAQVLVNQAEQRSASVKASAPAKAKAPASRASEQNVVWPRMRLRRKKILDTSRTSSRGGSKLARTSRPRAVGSLKWRARSSIQSGRFLRAVLCCVP
ncbi:hypothetical protein Salat_1282300 [Sesamum alatum]|uniref:Uncharacterized protein n=1 Tax=Sesamum alatum TaxID=300844 RepID=A0AAE2CPJ6_9LAMI|nr:hypothetical protein Salat_1282300 [Sesamum alatum]